MSKKKNKKNRITKYITKPIGGAAIDNKNNTNYAKPYTQTTYTRPACHKGNTVIYQYPDGGTLYIGGWNNGATFDWNTHVIDLTGLEHKYYDLPIAYDDASKQFLPFLMRAYAGWLSLPFPDYGTPSGMKTREQWEGVATTILGILEKGTDVLVACHGGHGRSGLFCAIVGYMLNVNTDPTWASPVEKIRAIHCDEAVETYAQEKFVYEILGLRIQPKHVYDDDMYWYGRYSNKSTPATSAGTDLDAYHMGTSFKSCPICGTQSLYTDEYGMCMTCRNAYESTNAVPVRRDLTEQDIKKRGLVDHVCTNEHCMGIWKAEVCGHVVHDMLIIDGLCETCYRKYEDEIEFAESKLSQEEGKTLTREVCALCGTDTSASHKFGICLDCSSKMVQGGLVTDVHNSITDPYKFIPHTHCEDEHMCVGVIRADVCLHVIHNREVEAGLCPICFEEKFGKEINDYAN